MNSAKIPRFMIAAPGSGTGKTTIVCAIMKALMNKGLKVAAFKSGPDYIDPMFHSRVIGAKSRNLDVFMLGKEIVKFLLAKNAADVDISVLEGVMGYYDGMGKTTDASAYDLACTTESPVILVVNGKGTAISSAATIKGFKEFRKDSRIVGAILNNMNPMSYLFYKDTIEKETGVKLLGYFPIMKDCNFESRHLGLVTADEIGDLQSIVDRLAEQAAKSLDLDALMEIASSASDLAYVDNSVEKLGECKIAVAEDKAFCFYYQDALDLLSELGAELIPFSPVNDEKLPECDGMFLGGGYPELYAKKLEENKSMLASIKAALSAGTPCYAECGGFMYLLERYKDNENTYNWVGFLEGESALTSKLQHFGYVNLEAQEDNVLTPKGGKINAHEFHYSDSTNNGSCFSVKKASGRGAWECGNASPTLYAGYPHIHLWGNKEFAINFVKACIAHKGNN